jgi:hypothetical protein
VAGKAKNASPRDVRWTKSVVTVLDYTPQTLAPHVEAMVAQWSAVTGGAVTLAYSRHDERACDDVRAQTGAIVVCAAPAQATPVGETILVRTGAVLRSAKIRYYGDGSEAYRDWCLLHELGHALGLEHQADGTVSVMYPVALSVSTLLPRDIAMVQALYQSANPHREQRVPNNPRHRPRQRHR